MIRPSSRETGQALVEFSLAIIVFMVLIMGIIDLGRLVYQYNGASQAARALARETSVHPGSPLGTSAETTAVLATQRQLMPVGTATYACVDIAGATVSGTCDARQLGARDRDVPVHAGHAARDGPRSRRC